MNVVGDVVVAAATSEICRAALQPMDEPDQPEDEQQLKVEGDSMAEN